MLDFFVYRSPPRRSADSAREVVVRRREGQPHVRLHTQLQAARCHIWEDVCFKSSGDPATLAPRGDLGLRIRGA